MRRIRSQLTYANVMSTLAVFLVASGGVAYAANTVFSTDIVDGEVKTADLASGAVQTGKIANNQVFSEDVRDDTLPNGGLASVDVSPNAIGSSEIATDAVQASEVANDSIDGGEIVDNSLSATDLASGAVGNAELGSSAVTGSKVANESLTSADLDGAAVNGHISLSAGAVANGRCKDFPITVGGATAGEAVIISTQAAIPEGIMIYGQRVPSNGMVTMKVCNLSGSTMAAITDLPIRVMTFS